MLTWQKLILYPAAIYAAIFLFISALIGFKVDTGAAWINWVTLAISIIGLSIASHAANIKELKKAAILGIVWVTVMVILDLILTVPFTGSDYFKVWTTYLAYAATFLVPVIFSKIK